LIILTGKNKPGKMKLTITNKWSNDISFPHGKSIKIIFDKPYFSIRISTQFHGSFQTEVAHDIEGNVFVIPAETIQPYINPFISFQAVREEEINITVEFI
jgi:hypothetical protein